ncbi:MAG: sensor histidine kinase [Spongiibacteraceae bacterium]
MILSRVFTSFTFRFLVSYIVTLSVSVFMILALIYAFIAYSFIVEVNTSIDDELLLLKAEYMQGGASAVDQFIVKRSGASNLIRFFYYVGDSEGNKVAGNLDSLPDSGEFRSGWQGFSMDSLVNSIEAIGVAFIARSDTLDNGETVLAARHYADVLHSTKLVAGALTRSMLVTIIFGTIGGAIVSALSLRRIENINTTLRRIMSGDFSERVDTSDSYGDYRRLSDNVNQMLDQIEVLMVGVRQVSDNIAHDLRTPLTRLRNHLSELHDTCDKQSREQVQNLIEEADGLLGTFGALLRIAQVESGNRRSEFGDVELCTLVSDVAELYEPLAAEKNQEFHTAFARVGAINGDRHLLFQAIANLVDNAIKYTPEGGRVHVGLAVYPKDYRIEIADSGIGIPEDDQSKVFQRFFRVESSRSRHKGNGLGLSLVHAVVKLHGGEITLESNHPGLRVILSFPRHNEKLGTSS